jgi:plasmid stabilization system protein ParE
MVPVFLTSKAQADLMSITTYVFQETRTLLKTNEFIINLEMRIQALSEFPMLGRFTEHPILSLKRYRILVLDQFVVLYLFDETKPRVTIIRILHQKSIPENISLSTNV